MSTIKRIKSGGIYEEKVGYCRAVVAGGFVHVAGTVAQGLEIPTDALGQSKSALDVIGAALEAAGSDFSRVVRVVYYMSDITEFESCCPALRERFGAHPPAATVIEAKLIDPKYRIEIEVTALG